MTIKQQGGIFGRNPSFNDLEAEQVTVNNKVNIKSNRPQIFLHEIDRTDNNARIECSFDSLNISQVDDSNGSPVARLTVEMDTGDVYVNDGNLVIGTSGKGIDFSATSGTGTSELFDDYEEGTWTPQLYDSSSTGGNASPTSGTGFYTKVGNTVTVWCSFSNISTSGMTAGNTVWVHGFPYSNGTAEGIGAVNCDTLNFGTGKTNVVVLMYPSNALALLKQTGNNVSDANTIVSGITSGTTDIVFTVTYKV